MNEFDMKERTRRFAMDSMHLVADLPKTAEGRAVGNQLIRSGTSVGADYRAACRGKLRADFVSKLGTVEDEADESCCWLENIIDGGGILQREKVMSLLKDANEITAMIVASRKTAGGSK